MRKRFFRACAVMLTVLALGGCGVPKSYEEERAAYVPLTPYAEKLSADEEKADALLAGMKEEADALYAFGTPYAVPEWSDDTYAGTKLYQFCKKLPKGADLHCHEYTMVSNARLVPVLKDRADICLAQGDFYGFLYASDNPDKPEGCVPIGESLDNGTLTEEQLLALMSLAGRKEGDRGWDMLSRYFSAISGLATNEDLYIDMYEEAFRSCYDNGLILLELRVSAARDDETNLARYGRIREAYYRVRKDHPEFRVRVIPCASKSLRYDKESAQTILSSVIRISGQVRDEFDPAKSEDFIIGLDLVSEEDKARLLHEYVDYLNTAEVKNSGLKLFLHCGESLKMSNDSVIDAYALGAVRVGHGFNLYRYPDLVERFAKERIAVEVCPISNYRLDYVADLRLHPALNYLRNGIPIAICSDDALFLEVEPLVDDYYASILSWNLDLADIKAICRNSITYSGLSKSESDELMKTWEAQWNSFVADLLSENVDAS